MGYYVTAIEGRVVIPKENISKAYDAMCALNDNDNLKRGGQWGGDLSKDDDRPAGLNYHPARWFAWMDANYPETCPDAVSVLRALGFDDAHITDSGDLSFSDYDSKSGQEELFLEAVSPLCREGSYLVWKGEDDSMWRQDFGSKMLTRSAEVSIRWV